MSAYLARRLVRSVVTLWLVASIVFVAFRLAGDPLNVLLPDSTDPITRAFYIEKWGFDKPLVEQYLRYFYNLAQGNLGQSYVSGRDVTAIIAEALPNTLLLGLTALAGSVLLGVGAGVVAALFRGTVIDRGVMLASVLAFSVPDYVLGVALIFVFAVQWMVLPSSGSATWAHMILPLVTIASSGAARIARFARSAMLDALNAPYLRTARAKGLREGRVVLRHALRNALIPIVTVLGFQLGFVLGGAAVVETVFAWPGIGRLFVLSTAARDLPVVQALTLLIAAGVIAANLAVDLAYGWLDPRISLSGGRA
ncbi:ABC transporter permease [Pseudoroseicyclus aestuarii]|uniref:Peptide/nickel transport system permease protein n=1 Tax=Pseudoroseicyclus aestuarii TaxID=1795041 RepID=A0A318SRZ5_9RHOB|nr:ABC transporter permease [Pseudoroseicyclus aestuarii]PYE80899.1 peptide/nickel transport system permease protein [Pseudoroseicyclus aestuarii]